MMNKWRWRWPAAVLTMAIGIYAVRDAEPRITTATAPVVVAAASSTAMTGAAPAQTMTSLFQRGHPPTPAEMAAIRQQRKQRMQAQGYPTPDAYFEMDLKQLNALADKGDVYAMLQLGEQYYNESASLQWDQDYNFNADPQQLGKQYLGDAAIAGHLHTGLVLAQKYLNDQQPDEAYAWLLLSKRLGDPAASSQLEELAGRLTPAQQQTARQRLAELDFRVKVRYTGG
ncbi:hypothetical protein GTP58_15845 [Duganella sp. CY15W]|uniref:hypothetical protein n=1 Tax=Duganella sp. CY15W TaxID=2692172 RepID=UPI00136C90FC|nr:hypothetical protein [Duganella sp. CY15W]MYM29804.1 hypothetical protein [Duganella sp. CY15W]